MIPSQSFPGRAAGAVARIAATFGRLPVGRIETAGIRSDESFRDTRIRRLFVARATLTALMALACCTFAGLLGFYSWQITSHGDAAALRTALPPLYFVGFGLGAVLLVTAASKFLSGVTSTIKRGLLTQELAALKIDRDGQAAQLTAFRLENALRDSHDGGRNGAGSRNEPHRVELESRLLKRLHGHGLPVATDEPVFLHVGFGHAGTTSLQLNFFAHRPDLFFLGTPFGDAGGLFSNLKYLEDHLVNEREMLDWCRDLAYDHPRRNGRPIVVSDETFCDASEVFYCPRHLPGDQVALRLKRYFPTAKVIFTIRNQLDYVSSMYFNLKRNYAFLAGMALPEFDQWWAGMHTQVRGLYLQNLDYSALIDFYGRLFGRRNLLVLPLEILKTHGARRYLETLCRFMNLELRECDIADFGVPRNERMTAVESRLAEVVTAGSTEWGSAVRSLLDKESLAGLVSNAPKLALRFDDAHVSEIRRAATSGNRRLAAEFSLPLGELGYFV